MFGLHVRRGSPTNNYSAYLATSLIGLSLYVAVSDYSWYDPHLILTIEKAQMIIHNVLNSECISSIFNVFFLTIFPAQAKSRWSLLQASQGKQDM